MWIDHRLEDPKIRADLRRKPEALRRKGIAGDLTLTEFQALRTEARGETSPRSSAGSAPRLVSH